jgi:hypothetical protein
MSRPSTPLGRARSRTGTKSPATIADRAVHKIAGKSLKYILKCEAQWSLLPKAMDHRLRHGRSNEIESKRLQLYLILKRFHEGYE